MTPLQLEIIGYIAGFLTTVCMVPQLWEIFYNKSARDVSVTTYFILLVGEVLWIVYGLFTNDLRIIVPNVASCTIGVFIIVLWFLYKNKSIDSDTLQI